MQDVRREHFSFSPRMPVGDFYEERDTPEVGLGAAEPPLSPPNPALCRGVTPIRAPQGVQWVKLSPEEIPGRIQAITGKRGRPRNAEKAKPKEPPATKRGRGRPPKVRMVDLLSKTDARLLKRLEAQGISLPSRGGEAPHGLAPVGFLVHVHSPSVPPPRGAERGGQVENEQDQEENEAEGAGMGLRGCSGLGGGVPWCRGSLSGSCPPLRPRTSRSRRPKPPGPRRPRRNPR